MATAENGLLEMETGQTLVNFVALTDSGDHISFNAAAYRMSDDADHQPDIKPNGVATGLRVTVAASGSNDVVDVTAGSCYLAGVLTSIVAGTDKTVTRATPADTHSICSITITDAGAIAVVVGTDGVAFSETRGAAGGPPLLPVGSIELGQVRMTSNVAAAITVDEIFMVDNQHRERYDYPMPTTKFSRVEDQSLQACGVDFSAALMLAHTGPVAKKVYAKYYTPIFAEIPNTENFVPPRLSHSSSTKQVYSDTLYSRSSSGGQGSFTAYGNGLDDVTTRYKDKAAWFKFYPNSAQTTRYIQCLGKLGIASTYPAGDLISNACTISPSAGAADEVTIEASL